MGFNGLNRLFQSHSRPFRPITDPSGPLPDSTAPPKKTCRLVDLLTCWLVDFQKKWEILFEKWGVVCCIDV